VFVWVEKVNVERVVDGSCSNVEFVRMHAYSGDHFEGAYELVIEFAGGSVGFNVSLVNEYKGAGGIEGGVVGALVSVGVFGVAFVGKFDEVGCFGVYGEEGGGVLRGVWYFRGVGFGEMDG
jgi:hypothetical protein